MLSWSLVLLGPSIGFWLLIKGYEWITGRDEVWRRPRRQSSPAADLGRLTADLRRLRLELDTLMRSDQPARALRLRAVGRAYDDTLCACCAALDLPAGPPPLDGVERIQTEAVLAKSGIDW